MDKNAEIREAIEYAASEVHVAAKLLVDAVIEGGLEGVAYAEEVGLSAKHHLASLLLYTEALDDLFSAHGELRESAQLLLNTLPSEEEMFSEPPTEEVEDDKLLALAPHPMVRVEAEEDDPLPGLPRGGNGLLTESDLLDAIASGGFPAAAYYGYADGEL